MEKTNVTNDPVSESGMPASNPPREGQSVDKELENTVRENLRAEYARKTEDLLEQQQAQAARIVELEEKLNLTQAQQREKQNLEMSQADLESELYQLQHDPKYRAYNTAIERKAQEIAKKTTEDAIHRMSVSNMESFLDDKAKELGIEPKTLAKELNALCEGDRYKTLLPHERARKVFFEYKEKLAIKKELEEYRKKKENETLHAERSGKEQVLPTYDEAKRNNAPVLDRIKSLGLYSGKRPN